MRERIISSIGFALLALCFVVALARIGLKQWWLPAVEGKEQVTIRVAHWQLEGGVRDAFNAMAEKYMESHPHVRIQQLPVPERIFPNWLITQLVGGTAPDIIQIGLGMTEERKARYFLPMSDLVDLPNPYNAGTDLDDVPLRDTFFDGMESSFSQELLEYYGLPLSGFTVRMYYNLNLLREITGGESLPTTYEELTRLCRQTMDYAKRTRQKISPIAGSKYNAPLLMDRLSSSQTGDLAKRLAYDFLPNRPSTALLASAFRRGDWSLETPEVEAAMGLMRDLGQYMQPGFMQLMRDDASFYFVQGRAVMIASGSWDSTSIRQQADFPVAVGPIPVPAPQSDPRWPYSQGPLADSTVEAGVVMAITRASKHPEIALDFLYFMGSKPVNQLWTDVSGWLPSVVGVKPAEQSKGFAPFLDGFIGGFNLSFSGADGMRVYRNSINRLVSPQGSVDDFRTDLAKSYSGAIAEDLRRSSLGAVQIAQRNDTLLAALSMLAASGEDRASEKLDLLLQSSAGNDYGARRTPAVWKSFEN